MTHTHDPNSGHWPVGFHPFYFPGNAAPAGHLPIAFTSHLQRRGLIVADGVRLIFDHRGDLTERLEDARSVLFEGGFIAPKRHEMMPVRATFDGSALAVIDRSALRPLGLWATKAHVNGLVRTEDPGEPDVWLSLRAAHSSAFPGFYDTLVAGGQPHDLNAHETAVKEAWEEAGIDASMMAAARHVHNIPVCYVSRQGFHQELLSIYDLVLPRDWMPTCMDGEVEGYTLVSIAELRAGCGDVSKLKLGSQLVCDDLVARLVRQSASTRRQ